MKKVILITSLTGQLGNRFVQFAHLIAFAIENKRSIINIPFYKYSKHFKSYGKDIPATFPVSNLLINKIPIKVLYYIFRLITVIVYKLNINNRLISGYFFEKKLLDIDGSLQGLSSETLLVKFPSKYTIVNGWSFVEPDVLIKHGNVIRSVFEPSSSHIDNIETHYKKVKQEGTIVVGVHIRRGDYRSWRNGQYAYDDSVFLERMREAAKEIDKKISFVICSNEIIELEEYRKELGEVNMGPGHFIEDLYFLAKCNYIIGPPSTYSIWASFYGKVPLFQMLDRERKFKLENTSVRLSL